MNFSTTRRISTFFGRLCHLAFLGFIAINIAATFILALSSMANYPGGVALATFNEMYANETNGTSYFQQPDLSHASM